MSKWWFFWNSMYTAVGCYTWCVRQGPVTRTGLVVNENSSALLPGIWGFPRLSVSVCVVVVHKYIPHLTGLSHFSVYTAETVRSHCAADKLLYIKIVSIIMDNLIINSYRYCVVRLL